MRGGISTKTKHTSPLACSDGFKRYHTLDFDLRRRFGGKMCKVPLSAGMTCPNRDGSRGLGGCSYCSGAGGGEFAPAASLPLREQFERGAAALRRKWPDAGLIAYFQAFSNTCAPPQRLRALLDEALALPGVKAVSLSTRADCIDGEKAALLGEYARRIPLTVELGLQTAHDETAARLNRCHSFAEFCEGYALLRAQGVRLCVHLIDGLPGESPEMMRQSAAAVAALDPDGVKLHMLHLLFGTALTREYERKPFPLLTLEEYVSVVCGQLELLPERCVIERITGDGAPDTLIAPLWTRKKLVVLNEIDKELLRRDSWQGKFAGGTK